MIDCSITKNFLSEKTRMTKCDEGSCTIKCSDCLLSENNNGKGVYCGDLANLYPEVAIAIVQKWSNEHPQQTMKDKFFQLFPNAPKQVGGLPKTCPKNLGWTDQCGKVKSCEECWNRPYEEVINKVDNSVSNNVKPKGLTNFDNIKRMSEEELAKLMDKIGIDPCTCCNNKECNDDGSNCVSGIINWLQQTVEK